MRQGTTAQGTGALQELAAEVQRQRALQKDYVVDTRKMAMMPEGTLVLHGVEGEFAMRDRAHRQLAAETDIPQRYYQRMLHGNTRLLAANVNSWMEREPKQRMVRALAGDGQEPVVRAIMSSRYRRLDYADLMTAALPTLLEHGSDLRVQSCALTEERLYIKASTARVTGTVRGQIVQAGVVIRNSEVGSSRVEVAPMILVLACLNGAVMERYTEGAVHLGRAAEVDDERARELYSTETLLLDDSAFWHRFRDVVRGTFARARFTSMLGEVEQRAGDPIQSPVAATKALAASNRLTEAEGEGILAFLASGGDLTRWGVSNAVTAYSQRVDDYERATELEALGGAILTLPAQEWETVARAA